MVHFLFVSLSLGLIACGKQSSVDTGVDSSSEETVEMESADSVRYLTNKDLEKENISISTLYDFPEDYLLPKTKKAYFGIDTEEYSTCYILFETEDGLFVIGQETEYDEDIKALYHCQNPTVSFYNDTIETLCEYNATIIHDFFHYNQAEFEHVAHEDEFPNNEIEDEMDVARKAGDGLLFCELSLGLQYIGSSLPYYISEGLEMLKVKVDSLMKEGKQDKVDTMICIFEESYVPYLLEESLKDWEELKEKRKNAVQIEEFYRGD